MVTTQLTIQPMQCGTNKTGKHPHHTRSNTLAAAQPCVLQNAAAFLSHTCFLQQFPNCASADSERLSSLHCGNAVSSHHDHPGSVRAACSDFYAVV